MPQLRWDLTDFTECLEVLPQTEEYETKHFFQVAKDGLRLDVSVWPYESVISIDLYRDGIEYPVIGFAFLVRDEIKHIKEKGGEWLEVRDCVPVPSRFSYMDHRKDLFDVHKVPNGLTVRLQVKPHFRIEYSARRV